MKKVFFSFEYATDVSRVSQVRNMGVVEKQPLLSSNDWEKVKSGGKVAIENWIDEQMKYKNCIVVLIGATTAGREWVNYEIEKGWNKGKGVVGIHIHNLRNINGFQSRKGANPFNNFTVNSRFPMSSIVNAYDPPSTDSRAVYADIAKNINTLVDEAIAIRSRY